MPTRAQVLREAAARIPVNSLGLPEGYYNSDLLDPDLVVRGILIPTELATVLNQRKNQQPQGGSNAVEPSTASLDSPANPPPSTGLAAQEAYEAYEAEQAQEPDDVERQPRDEILEGSADSIIDGIGRGDTVPLGQGITGSEASAHSEAEPRRSSAPDVPQSGTPSEYGRTAPAGGTESRPGAQGHSSEARVADAATAATHSAEHEDSGNPTSAQSLISEDYRPPAIVFNEKLLRNAYVPLNYDEGYPVLPDGKPYWQQLDFEPLDAFVAFQAYVEMGSYGSRQLFLLQDKASMQQKILIARSKMNQEASRIESRGGFYYPETNTNGSSGSGYSSQDNGAARRRPALTQAEQDQRDEEDLREAERAKRSAIDGSGFVPNVTGGDALELADTKRQKLYGMLQAGADHDTLVDWYYLYHWSTRALAHDLFYVESIRRGREAMALQLENTHLQDSTQLYKRLQEIFDPDNVKYQDANGESRFWQKLANSPKTATEFFKTLIQMQRLSVGIPQDSPSATLGSFGSDGTNSNSNSGQVRQTRGRGRQAQQFSQQPQQQLNTNRGISAHSQHLRPDDHGRINPEAHAAAGQAGQTNGNGSHDHRSPMRGLGGFQPETTNSRTVPGGAGSQNGPAADERARRIAQLLDLARARQAGSTPQSRGST